MIMNTTKTPEEDKTRGNKNKNNAAEDMVRSFIDTTLLRRSTAGTGTRRRSAKIRDKNHQSEDEDHEEEEAWLVEHHSDALAEKGEEGENEQGGGGESAVIALGAAAGGTRRSPTILASASAPIMDRAMSLLESSADSQQQQQYQSSSTILSPGRAGVPSSSAGSSSAPPPAGGEEAVLPAGVLRNPTFPFILYTLLQDAAALGFEDIVSWLPAGNGLKVHNKQAFEERIMGKYFQNQTRYKSFLRQLNFYGFNRVTKGQWKGCLYHEMFKRGSPFLCHNIKREKRPEPSDRGSGTSSGNSQHQRQHIGVTRSTKEEDRLLPTTSAYLNTKAELPMMNDDPAAASVQRSLACLAAPFLKNERGDEPGEGRRGKRGDMGRKRPNMFYGSSAARQQQGIPTSSLVSGNIRESIALEGDETASAMLQQNDASSTSPNVMARGTLSGLFSTNQRLPTNLTRPAEQQNMSFPVPALATSSSGTVIELRRRIQGSANTAPGGLTIPPDIASEIIATFCAGGSINPQQQHQRQYGGGED